MKKKSCLRIPSSSVQARSQTFPRKTLDNEIRGEQVVVDVGELIRHLVSVHRLVLFLPDMYRPLDPSVNESERRTAIRQTVPKKTSVEVETSTLI